MIPALGPEVGHEATEEALIWAWEHWDRAQLRYQAALDDPEPEDKQSQGCWDEKEPK